MSTDLAMRRWRVSRRSSRPRSGGCATTCCCRTGRRRSSGPPARRPGPPRSPPGSSSSRGAVSSSMSTSIDVAAGDARRGPALAAQADHVVAAHDRHRRAVGEAVDGDGHRRTLPGPQRLDDARRHLDPGRVPAGLQDRGAEPHLPLLGDPRQAGVGSAAASASRSAMGVADSSWPAEVRQRPVASSHCQPCWWQVRIPSSHDAEAAQVGLHVRAAASACRSRTSRTCRPRAPCSM